MTRHRHDGLPHYATVNVNCRIPEELHQRIKLLLLDPLTGRVRDRGWSLIIQEGLEMWLARQQQPAAPTSTTSSVSS